MESKDLNSEFTLGFIFNLTLDKVVLVEHNKWNRLNGLGGHLKENESPIKGFIREVKEESGAIINDALLIGIMEDPTPETYFKVFIFAATADLRDFSTPEDGSDKIVIENVKDICYPRNDIMKNLIFLIPLAVDCLSNINSCKVAYFNY